MRNTMFLVLFAGLVLAAFNPGPAGAQLACTDPDLVAVIFDNEDINFNPPVATPYNMQVRLLNPSGDFGINAFEFNLVVPPNTLILSSVLPPGSVNVGDPPSEFIVGFPGCEPTVDGQILLVDFTLISLDASQGDFFINLTRAPSIPGNLAYQECSGPPLIPMYPISGDFLLPVARINGPALVYCDSVPGLDMIVDIAFKGDTDNRAATSPGATDGFDVDYDLLDSDGTVTFPHPEWGNPAGDYYKQDVMASYDPTLEMKQWTFTATASSSQSGGETVSMDFGPNFAVPATFDFRLRDNTTGVITDLNTTLTYSFWIPEGTSTRSLDLFIGNDFTGPGEFYVDVGASVNGYFDQGNRAGTLVSATDGFDSAFDTPEPGPPPANYVVASYNHPDWPLGPRFRNDLRAVYDPLADAKVWPLMVETDQSGSVTLVFDPSFTDADNFGLQLKDLQTGQSFDLFPNLSYVFTPGAATTHYFELTVGLVSAPDLDPTYRYLYPGWSMIGMPLLPAPGLDTFDQVILNQAPGYVYAFEYLGPSGYGIRGGSDPANYGQGYWIATDTGFNWTMTGDRVLNPTAIPLTEGWNLIGNPLWFPAPFEGIHVQYGGMTYPWQDAINLGLVSTGVLSYDNQTGDYFNAVDLRPWNGYWVNSLVTGAMLWFDWPNFQVLPARLAAQKSGLPITDFLWETELTMVDADRVRKSIVFGVHPESTPGFDPRFDMPQPPSSPNGGSRLAFARPEWDLAAGDYFTRDIRPEGKDPLTWKAVVSTNAPGKVVLSWNSVNWPEGMDYQVYLPEENRVVVMSMREQRSIHLEVGNDPVPIVIRTPNMLSGVEDMQGMNYAVGVHPNPFNPMATIHFDLPRAADAEIRIYSVRGELFSILGGQHYQAGRQEVVWNGRDRHGRNAPSGSYFARLYVDGQGMGSVTKMSLVR
ncbi:MAG: hypothetical protein ABFS42_08980 [Candidatus Krumholzibacteriota bacterium]